DLIDVQGCPIHNPNFGIDDIPDLARGTEHQPGKNRSLLSDEERSEGDREDQTEVLRSVACEHFKSNEVHLSAASGIFPASRGCAAGASSRRLKVVVLA